MQDHKNTIAGWVLFAGIIALGASIVSGEMFHSERPEKMGYPIEGVVLESEGAAAAVEPIAMRMQTAEEAKGEVVFKKCAACHNVENGGANAIGPNLWAVVGKPHAAHPGFAFSDALKSKPGNWDFAALDEWLANPKKYAPGTKMSFAGLGNPMDRANVILYLNAQGSNLPLPAAPAAAEGAAPTADPKAAEKAAAETAIGGGAEKAPNQPVLNQADAVKSPSKSSGGDASAAGQ